VPDGGAGEAGKDVMTDTLTDRLDGLGTMLQPLSHDRLGRTDQPGKRRHASSTTT